jgi:aminopeptidase N
MTMRNLSFFGLFILIFMLGACRSNKQEVLPVQGVSKKLNDQRFHDYSDLVYQLDFQIPEKKTEAIKGKLLFTFHTKSLAHPVVLDFQNPSSHIQKIRINHQKADYRISNHHIIIPTKALIKGKNQISIDFIAGNQALNRNDDFLYTLFVPGRASTAFPCMDQPNLKARFRLSLHIPKNWIAVANARESERHTDNNQQFLQFAPTKPISTYLFSFVAGKFKKAEKTFGKRTLRMYYRETDSLKVSQNLNDVFHLEANAIRWMEKYTGIPYPFGKFDFILIPAFQYSGMEHPGAVLYRASRVFLDPSATQTQKLFRASLIAHETAHMWFGDLVTMNWFDDVWLKEVFANFMAAKIVEPAFPGINQQLSFLIDHFPKAYAVDRTPGANPIKQKLNNLNMAGMLYGAIIYHKAPIVMMKLEDLIGKKELRTGLQEYLHKFQFANADWDDLINILDRKTPANLKAWSHVWVKESGMPHYEVLLKERQFTLEQNDPQKGNRIWPQAFHYININQNSQDSGTFFNDQKAQTIELHQKASMVWLNADGKAYGFIHMSPAMKQFMGSNGFMKLNAIQRASAYISMWENLQNGVLSPTEVNRLMRECLERENTEQNINYLLSIYPKLFWRFNTQASRHSFTKEMEKLLWQKISLAPSSSLKAAYYHAWLRTVTSKEGIQKMVELWDGKQTIRGLKLSENDKVRLSYELAVRQGIEGSSIIPRDVLQQQLLQTKNPDKKKEIAFVMPALSENIGVRTEFFERLKEPSQRKHEPWVNTAVSYLHHPLRAQSAEKFILPSLEMLEEIQQTGDIFFPKSWLDATFSGHHSQKSVEIIEEFLNKNHDLDIKLKQKILQSADPVFRASKMIEKMNPQKNL